MKALQDVSILCPLLCTISHLKSGNMVKRVDLSMGQLKVVKRESS